jgi:hypothetical protein
MQRDDAFLRAWRDTAAQSPDPEDEERQRPPLHFRTLWISDLHLGTPGCQARALLDFLKHTECETLFLVGDIIDGWQLKRHWYWPQAHNDVIQKLLRKARKGTRVIFIRATTTSSPASTSTTTSAASTWPTNGSTKPPTAASSGSSTATCSTA